MCTCVSAARINTAFPHSPDPLCQFHKAKVCSGAYDDEMMNPGLICRQRNWVTWVGPTELKTLPAGGENDFQMRQRGFSFRVDGKYNSHVYMKNSHWNSGASCWLS
ncbi:hypothetical protein KIL84_023468 [Mauremys mutica]|uniref:Uncharacterized protein n=1 Tax=Mauremys mutica TaxID=74926 RepID=A0A9D3WM24_9SAUR|nr:hypothetical protein KIL84_023468 [Mauremys mutica]